MSLQKSLSNTGDSVKDERSDLVFPPYVVEASNYTHQGFYRCVVEIPGPFASPILSNTTDVQFIGMYFRGILFWFKTRGIFTHSQSSAKENIFT